MGNKLVTAYRNIDKEVKIVYVSPRIEHVSKFNPYIDLFYKDFLVKSPICQNIEVKSFNPLLPLILFKKLIGEKSILHCHWLEVTDGITFLITLAKIIIFFIYSLLNGKIVWSIHNKYPHTKKLLFVNKIIYRIMAKLAVKFHAHSYQSAAIMSSILHVNIHSFFIVEHPLYPVSYVPKNKAINRVIDSFEFPLLREQPIFLIYGFISEYKGIAEILPFFAEQKLQLIIAGKCKKGEEEYCQEISKLVKNQKHILLKAHFISKEDETNLFNAADFILFNFKDILSSGSVILALSYKKEVIIPDIGCLRDMSGSRIHKFTSFEECKQIILSLVHTYQSKG